MLTYPWYGQLGYDFYDKMNSTDTINHLEKLKINIMKSCWWKRLILIWDNASYRVNQMARDYVNAQKDWLTIIHLPTFYQYIEELKDQVSRIP